MAIDCGENHWVNFVNQLQLMSISDDICYHLNSALEFLVTILFSISCVHCRCLYRPTKNNIRRQMCHGMAQSQTMKTVNLQFANQKLKSNKTQ